MTTSNAHARSDSTEDLIGVEEKLCEGDKMSSEGEDDDYLLSWRKKRGRLFLYWCFTHFIFGK